MVVIKSASADLRRRYPLFFEIGLAASLGLAILLFTVPFESSDDFVLVEHQQEIVRVEDIEQTRQIEQPPPPQAPSPIEVANDAFVEEITLNFDMDLDLDEAATRVATPPPPPPPASAPEVAPPPAPEEEIFVIVEEPPQLIGGIQGIQDRLQYPEVARLASLQGTVYLQFVVDEQGNVVDPVCVREPGGGTCEEALRVIRDAKFEPGRQRGKPVKVRFALPVKFRLN